VLQLGALSVAFLLGPPLLGRVGFAAVSATVAAGAFPLLRVSPLKPAAALDDETRELDKLGQEIETRADEGWEARVAAGLRERRRRWSAWQSLPV
jgi:hypothetical protein